MTRLQRLNLTLRALMELGVVAALATWGFHAGTGTGAKSALGIGAPLLGFGFWGTVDFHQAGRFAELLRLTQELLISGLAALAWHAAGQPILGWSLAILSVLHHALVYAQGDVLLETGAPEPGRVK